MRGGMVLFYIDYISLNLFIVYNRTNGGGGTGVLFANGASKA